MKNLLMAASCVLAFLLSGCLGKLETLTEDTKSGVMESVRLISETEDGQKLAGALALVDDEKRDEAIRSAAAETVIFTAKPERLYKYIGATRPLNFYHGYNNEFPNVSFIGTKSNSRENLSPISAGTYRAFEMATMRVLRELSDKMSTNVTGQEEADYKAKAYKMFTVATAILGAKVLNTDLENRDIKDAVAEQKANQDEAKKLLFGLTTLFDEPALKERVKRIIDVRFGNSPLAPTDEN